MGARRFNKRIKVYQSVAVADGYGGNTVTDTLILTTWAEIKTQGSQKISDLGLDYTKGTILVTTRKREDIAFNSSKMYITYRGEKYTISTFPINENFVDAYISFTAVKEKPATFTDYTAT